MGLNNEAYIVNTKTSGEVIVPVREGISYLNVKFLGWQFYNYHEVMSQNIANLADDINTLKDGGGASLTFNLNEILASTQKTIDTKLLDIDNVVINKVTALTEEILYNTNQRISSLDVTINGKGTTKGLVELIAAQTMIIGDSTNGLVKDINNIKNIIGESGSGLIGKVDTNTNNLNMLMGTIGNSTIGLVKQVNENGALGSTLNIKINEIDNIIGDINSGLIKDVNTNKTNINKLIPVVGDSTNGLVKDIIDLKNSMSQVELGTNVAALTAVVGDSNTGLIAKTNLLDNEITGIKTIIGDQSSGIITDINTLKSYNLPQMKTDIYGVSPTTGLINIVGDSTKGLVKAVEDLKLTTAASIPASAADLLTVSNNLTTTNTNLSTTISNLTTTSSKVTTITDDINTIKGQLNTVGTGVLSNISNMPNTITNTLLTYSSGSITKVFDQNTLYSMYSTSKELIDKDVINQFRTYFFNTSTNAYLANVEIGKPAVDFWINDKSVAGYSSLTNQLIKTQIATNPTLDQITRNKDAISLLNGPITTVGSVTNQVGVLDHLINSTDPLDMGTITRLNGNSTIQGSVDFKIKANNDYLLSGTGALGSTITSVQKLQNDMSAVNLKLDQTTEEIQIEMVRYSTIMPFLQQMFKLVNKVDNVTDTEIDTIFTNISDKLAALTISTVDYRLSYSSTDGGFTIKINLDKDFKFLTYTNLDAYYLLITDLNNNEQTIILNTLQLSSKSVDIFVPKTLYDLAGNSIILTDTQALSCKLSFRIINSFGIEQMISVPIS